MVEFVDDVNVHGLLKVRNLKILSGDGQFKEIVSESMVKNEVETAVSQEGEERKKEDERLDNEILLAKNQSVVRVEFEKPYLKIIYGNDNYRYIDLRDLVSDTGSMNVVTHTQNTPSNEWHIRHFLDRYVYVIVMDDKGESIVANVTYPSLNEVVVKFNYATAGMAVVR